LHRLAVACAGKFDYIPRHDIGMTTLQRTRQAGDGAMRLIGLAGWSGAGKTTLLVRVIPLLVARGLRVSTIKHAHHAFDVDRPGKDSFRHREAGASEVLVASANRFALMHELRGEPEPDLPALVARMAPVDLLLVEGFRSGTHPKLEVFRQANGKTLMQPDDPAIVAVASDVALDGLPVPVAALDDVQAIAGLLLSLARPVGEALREAAE
jgi:molybdopterin-guanine dinucleotide biosynthesis adapter protein